MVATPDDGSCGIGTYARDLIKGIGAVSADTVEIPQDDRSIPAFLQLAVRAARGNGDVVHVQHEYGLFRREGSKYPGVLGLLFFPVLYVACALRSKSIVVTMHSVLDFEPDEAPFSVRLYLLLMHKLLAVCSAHLIFLAPDCASKFQGDIALESDEYSLLSHGVNTDVSPDLSKAEAKRRFGYDPDEPVVAIPGFIRPPKGHDIFLEVASKLPEYEFMIAGGARPKGEDFEFAEQIKADAPDNVTVTGVLDDDDYWAALKAPDLAVLPYRVVTQSGTFNACATQELPVLASDAEYFERIEGAWGTPETVDVSDADEVAERVRQLMEDESRRTKLADVMAQYKRANSFEQVGTDHRRIYDRVQPDAESELEPSVESA
ncbi:glycosyltransferase [Halorubrum sp. CSM-61]|uniref:glycosyltransferase n=1 Tax=Halorubrum sp. CSM-61 TaxID=2485838 RepID=UPI0013DE6BA0|nr:glycosyltransferase [Halorubrum sp. CSM-61]